MSKIPDELRYTKNHEWARLGDDKTVTVGISDHAQDLLGDLVLVRPEDGKFFCGLALRFILRRNTILSDHDG